MLKQQILEGRMTAVHKETNRLLEAYMNNESENAAEEKSAANMHKKAEKLEDVIEEKRNFKKKIVHDLKIIKNEITNTKIQIDEIQTETNDINKELKNSEEEVKVSELNHKSNYNEIQKKQLRVDKLNKQFEELKNSVDDESARNELENKKNK
jgi:chromosome segregation ATPase